MNTLGLDNINDPRLMQAISSTNNSNLNKPWNLFMRENANPTVEQVIEMIHNAGNEIDFDPSPFRLPNAI